MVVFLEMIDYNSPQQIKEFLEFHGLGMQKKFGQNFLINSTARTKIIKTLELDESSRVWEVGPGLGCMTSEILDMGANLTAFEIDRGFSRILKDFFGKKKNFKLVEGDVLKTWKAEQAIDSPQIFVGNLPYNIAATLFADFISHGIFFEKGAITIQKEVALRMTAKPHSKDYSSFSVLCQWMYEVKPLMDLGAGSFWPPPHVDSRAVLFTKKENPPACSNPQLFLKILRALFSSRRKTIKNNLGSYLKNTENSNSVESILEKADLDLQLRAENLTLEQIIHLSNIIDSC
ncbi:MAG: 16S rRNA (adenine(1518)-N(6)/adenine(1519)-N(6))-dimethyltransferase RsmA [Treponemataceae bacterium]